MEDSVDGYAIAERDPQAKEQFDLGVMLEECAEVSEYWEKFKELQSARRILEASKPRQVRYLLAVYRRKLHHKGHITGGSHNPLHKYCQVLRAFAPLLHRRNLPLTTEDLVELLRLANQVLRGHEFTPIVTKVKQYLVREPLAVEVESVVGEIVARLKQTGCADSLRSARQFVALLDEAKDTASLLPQSGEPWVVRMKEDLAAGGAPTESLIEHAKCGNKSRPSATWSRRAQEIIDHVGRDTVVELGDRWLRGLEVDRKCEVSDESGDLLRGVAWFLGLIANAESIPVLGVVCEAGYRKLPDVGARCAKAANAALWALEQIAAPKAVAAELLRVRHRVKYRNGLKAIQKSMDSAAVRAGLSALDLEELSVPDYNLDRSGSVTTALGAFEVRLEIGEALVPTLRWFGADSKARKSPPRALREEFPSEVKAVRAQAKEMTRTLAAQRSKLEETYSAARDWSLDEWRERFLDHGLLLHVVETLIWSFRLQDEVRHGGVLDGVPTDLGGRPIDLPAATRVSLWHPLDNPKQSRKWASWLDDHHKTQMFKQAHRETYVVTEAEREAEFSSARFAGHIVRQHAFAALLRERSWQFKPWGAWADNDYPFKTLPDLQLVVRLDLDIAPEERAVASAPLYEVVTIGEVRFARSDGAPVPLESIPPKVFSEVMRDLDLFTSVCSIMVDPEWANRDELEYRHYRDRFFGELTEVGKTRKRVLEDILPRLNVADRVSIEGNYVVVQGQLGSYRVHIGSGNVLAGDRRHLCIIPKGRSATASVRLPFEGDSMLSVVLSKVLLFVADDKIKDPAILSQLRDRLPHWNS